MTSVVSLSLDLQQFETLQRLAHMTRRDQGWHLRQALALYLQEQPCLDPVEEGLADARAGHLLDLADIEAKWRKKPSC
ncbi:ribbon-helix-helix protein, CopG family [Pseudomonas sp. 21LCFQ02]|uniref:CopG family ribbon-helix-helix protein n=1 Tax=unclassified Pseudomonas TaxID=196821 RepID=UPI0004F61BAD|nr:MULTISPECIES: ribbon-helix-helix protein, CopG family [unclassified Pseudomonas]MCO8164260.1 ribbon-helix-helix protein, CopG family [Pseudomonas sp. 21LCFQ010]MCO8169014.1 ribbon-helix-helix protein, CopG family [Pseudomonas sp. 21LCFQ02]MCQ9425653.1 ribbon-helix-helix protein, CopG family [Pseudomonas sp. LJDD11]BAP45983.1 putative transcriptional regulator [Pseudomonas sp. StFLB209]